MKPHLDALTATRAIAAIMVVIHHFGCTIAPFSYASRFFHNGNLAVGYFFVLSGFVMYTVYADSDERYWPFIKKRLARIAPLYYVGLALGLIVIVIDAHNAGWVFPSRIALELPACLLFLQSFIPSFPLAINGPAWSLSVEMFFYLLFIPLLRLQRRHLQFFVALAVILYCGSQAFHCYYFSISERLSDRFLDVITFEPVLHVNQFLIGMITGYCFKNHLFGYLRKRWVPLVLTAIVGIVIALRPDKLSYHTGLIAPLFAILILSIAMNVPKVLTFRPFIYLGNASYAIYILQDPVHTFAVKANATLQLADQTFFYGYVMLLIIISVLAYQYLEIPMRHRINQWGNKNYRAEAA